MADLTADELLVMWPQDPGPGWLGAWAAKQDDLPDPISRKIVREFYQMRRAVALGLPTIPVVPPDVVRLVIAARVVAFERQDAEAMRELDQASEAFAELVPWDEDPDRFRPQPDLPMGVSK